MKRTIYINDYHLSGEKIGMFEHNTTKPFEELNSLINNALENNLYISIVPPIGLSEEFKKRGDIIMFYSKRRLSQG